MESGGSPCPAVDTTKTTNLSPGKRLCTTIISGRSSNERPVAGGRGAFCRARSLFAYRVEAVHGEDVDGRAAAALGLAVHAPGGFLGVAGLRRVEHEETAAARRRRRWVLRRRRHDRGAFVRRGGSSIVSLWAWALGLSHWSGLILGRPRDHHRRGTG